MEVKIDTFYEPMKRWIRTVLNDVGYLNSLFIVGEGGLGKTYSVLDTLRTENIEFVYTNNYSSIVGLYNFLFENKDKVIVFDDFETMWDIGNKGINIFKGAFWGIGDENKRIISYKSTSKLVTAPEQFVFEGKMIFLLNKFPEKQDSMIRALVSRASVYKLEFNRDQVFQIMGEFVKLPYRTLDYEQRVEVFEFLKWSTEGMVNSINFRTLIKMYDVYINNPDDWQAMCCQILGGDDRVILLKRILRDCLDVNEAEEKFCSEAKCSRATFYRLKKRLG